MASVSLDWKTGDAPKDVVRDFKQLAKESRSETAGAVTETTKAVTREAKFNAPVDTGRLKHSISNVVRKKPVGATGFVGSNLSYAPHVEYGTRPHQIGYGLRFKWPNAPPSEKAYFISIGSWPYVMYDTVSHPGTEPTYFLSRAVESQRPAFYARIRRAVQKAERKASDD